MEKGDDNGIAAEDEKRNAVMDDARRQSAGYRIPVDRPGVDDDAGERADTSDEVSDDGRVERVEVADAARVVADDEVDVPTDTERETGIVFRPVACERRIG